MERYDSSGPDQRQLKLPHNSLVMEKPVAHGPLENHLAIFMPNQGPLS